MPKRKIYNTTLYHSGNTHYTTCTPGHICNALHTKTYHRGNAQDTTSCNIGNTQQVTLFNRGNIHHTTRHTKPFHFHFSVYKFNRKQTNSFFDVDKGPLYPAQMSICTHKSHFDVYNGKQGAEFTTFLIHVYIFSLCVCVSVCVHHWVQFFSEASHWP